MHLNKHAITILFLIGCIGLLAHPAEARVDKSIQKTIEKRYEEKVFFLRENLIAYDGQSEEEFVTDLYGFVQDVDDKEVKETVVFTKGEKVIISKVDFDAKTIEITIRSLERGTEGTIVFDFDDRLSDQFDEKLGFTTRFDEIFLKESLKELPDFTDRISIKIQAGSIERGMSLDELILTLGTPSDIVKQVDAVEKKTLFYRTEKRTYIFSFENDTLERWIEY